jgi:hypothetical protein
VTLPYSKFLSLLARLGNALIDYLDNRSWSDTQRKRQEWLDAKEKEIQDRIDKLDNDRNDGLRKLRAKIKAESSK